ncbi:Hypothetical predicted protein [Pelobates cultripes]|uniref:Uncharacterized protein n=1 Tax=Pelobates cultripes TaxID=61616 RepID=A0AAD1WYQ5_PELCU|nr:Hypothetical predicted protein [Pelobates cultripes]
MLHTASNWSTWLSSQKEASSKDDAQENPQTVAVGYLQKDNYPVLGECSTQPDLNVLDENHNPIHNGLNNEGRRNEFHRGNDPDSKGTKPDVPEDMVSLASMAND